MKRDLSEAHKRFEAAANVDIIAQWVKWPEYEAFTQNLNLVLKLLDTTIVNNQLRSEIEGYKFLRRSLRNTPLHPQEHILHSSMAIGVLAYEGQLGTLIEKLRESIAILANTENPMREEVRKFLVGESRIKLDGSNSVQLLVPLKLVDAMNNAASDLRGATKNISAMGTTAARRSDIADVMFIFGNPENLANYYKHGVEKSREIAWLFNAPAARQVVIFQLADSVPFEASKYEIWAGSNQFDVKPVGTRPSVMIEHYEQSMILDDIVVNEPLPTDPIVDASIVHLFNHRFIYFSDQIPPFAICVRNGEAGVEIDDDVRVSSLRPGDVLLLRTGEASRSFLREHAIKWLRESHKEKDIQHFISVADTYKKQLQTKYRNADFINRLVRDGLEEHYVRHQILQSFLPSKIATQRKENFIKISQALDLKYGDVEWDAIVKIQTAHRQAGHIAVRELREGVLADESWLETVTEPGIATLNAGAAGEIVLIPVVQKSTQIVQVSIHSIGQLQINQRMFNE